ncbi:MAG: hypothetical protein JO113_04625 [Candidatus Eremiobacteraeota bacterium]|nr:hypothetical protein [Candidatus Eremiobacteraeota bacterium]
MVVSGRRQPSRACKWAGNSRRRDGEFLALIKPFAVVAPAAIVLLAACSSGARSELPFPQADAALRGMPQAGASKIRHVVYIVQENRSFNDLFIGYPGAYTVAKGRDSKGRTIALQPIALAHAFDMDHSAGAMIADCDGAGKLPGTKCRMNGFDKEQTSGGPRRVKHPMYSYVPPTDTKPYFEMAHEWVLADRMFQSQLDESFVAHQYIIAAQAESSVNIPYGPWGCVPGPDEGVATLTRGRTLGNREKPCFDYQTLGDELDEAGLTWRFYTSWYKGPGDSSAIWSSYQAVKHIFDGPDWTNVITPQKRFIKDVRAGRLANFMWITPMCKDSDHPGCGGGFGPSWVSALINAVGESKFWDSTVVFVQWDDWGGFYDPVPPPFKDYDGLGFRVPLIVISAYAKRDYVSHVQYETASVLRYAEDLFGLGQLASADRRAVSPAVDCLDFTQRPRRFVPIAAPYDRDFFLTQSPDYRPPDNE